jgi:histidine ammonia-lyase
LRPAFVESSRALSNGLPTFLTRRGGLNSGFMVAQYTAAALVSENKSFAHPASVDSIPTSANQEDHVSMGTIAARKARMILHNFRHILAIELLCACQGLDLRTSAHLTIGDDLPTFCHDTTGTMPGLGVTAAYNFTRKHIKHLAEDRDLSIDIAAAEQLIASGALLAAVETVTGTLN